MKKDLRSKEIITFVSRVIIVGLLIGLVIMFYGRYKTYEREEKTIFPHDGWMMFQDDLREYMGNYVEERKNVDVTDVYSVNDSTGHIEYYYVTYSVTEDGTDNTIYVTERYNNRGYYVDRSTGSSKINSMKAYAVLKQ